MTDYETPDYKILEHDLSALLAHAEEIADGQGTSGMIGLDPLAMDIANTITLLINRIELQQAELRQWHPGYINDTGSGSTVIHVDPSLVPGVKISYGPPTAPAPTVDPDWAKRRRTDG